MATRKPEQSAAVVLLLILSAAPGNSATLTGAVLFSADTAGNANTGPFFNTLGGDSIPNLYLTTATIPQRPPAPGTFYNGGDGAATSINLPLTGGNYVFGFWVDPGSISLGVGPDVGLNLFFDGNTSPGISAYGMCATAFCGIIPQPDSGTTKALNGANIAGFGSLTFVAGITTISLTGLKEVATLSDYVGPFNNVPNNLPDYFGTFSLAVVVPEPGTKLLFLIGTAVLALIARLLRDRIARVGRTATRRMNAGICPGAPRQYSSG